MRFFEDPNLRPGTATHLFGEYRSSFESDNQEVRADLFERGGQLLAYVSFAAGLDAESVTDSWLRHLHRKADDLGFSGKLRLIYDSAAVFTGNKRLKVAGAAE